MMPIYYRHTHIVIVVYSVTSRKSYDSCYNWINDADHYIGACRREAVKSNNHISKSSSNSNQPVPVVVIIGNKIDESAKREVSCEEGLLLKERVEHGFPDSKVLFFETSAKTINSGDSKTETKTEQFLSSSNSTSELNSDRIFDEISRTLELCPELHCAFNTELYTKSPYDPQRKDSKIDLIKSLNSCSINTGGSGSRGMYPFDSERKSKSVCC
ncbi:GTPase [Yasminevirus sp. GU-2018]|uniref:GTPase n=1 Tax=Yasminevirus sp. GU-2018 TaxID=2420051 RepID=A0A5K0UAC3_9VIRU|nr:GTPase [Yasminevirus sp. GU-2018]